MSRSRPVIFIFASRFYHFADAVPSNLNTDHLCTLTDAELNANISKMD